MNISLLQSEAEVSLVDLREASWPNALFVTISPNPTKQHFVYRQGRRVKFMYKHMTHDEQYEYCMEIVQKCYQSIDSKIFGVWELNESKNVHFHLLLSDPSVTNEVTLDFFRRTIFNMDITLYNLGKSKNPRDWMNSIFSRRI